MTTPDRCLICDVEVQEDDAVYIERHNEGSGPEGWSADFCSDEHAAVWVARPFLPPSPPMSTGEEWADRVFFLVLLVLLAFVLVSLLVGAITVVGWVLRAIF